MKKASKKVVLANVRCGYTYLENTNKDDKYSVQGLLPTNSKLHKQAHAAMKEVFIESFGESEWAKRGKYKLALRDGDNDTENGGQPKDGDEYRDHHFFNASNKRKPKIRNRYNKEATQSDIDEYCYSGAYFNLVLAFSAFPAKEGGKPGIGCYVNAVMLWEQGDRLDGASSGESEFSEFAVAGGDETVDDFDDL